MLPSRRLVLVAIGGLALLAAGAVVAGRRPASAGAVAPVVRIVIDGTRFHPPDAVVPLGSGVIWENRDPFPHNVQADAGRFQSEAIAADTAWRWQPTERGRFDYRCTLHPGMTGVLVVR